MDNNASSQRCIKWTVKYSIQAFCKSSSHLDRKHGYITDQSNTFSKWIVIAVKYNQSLATTGNNFLYTAQYNKMGTITISIWPYVNISRTYEPPAQV